MDKKRSFVSIVMSRLLKKLIMNYKNNNKDNSLLFTYHIMSKVKSKQVSKAASMNTLIIVESPPKCKSFEEYLGPGYKAIASYGHIRNIEGLTDIDVNNNFAPSFSISKEPLKLKQIEKIRVEISKADEVIIATDNDREGEAIGWHICDLFGLPIETTKRLIFHEVSKDAIQSAIAYPKRINMDIVQAQHARQILDLLVGFTISPILWKYISKNKDNSLSAGRCQTPALRLIYDNYLDIKQSPGKFVYNTTGYFTNLNLPFDLSTQLTTRDDVIKFLTECKTWEFICNVSEPKKKIQQPPKPLTTSSLQQLASNEMNMSPKDTMKCAQQLYENGFITYMRTDSKKYSGKFVNDAADYIKNKYGEQFLGTGLQIVDNEELSVKNKFAEKHNIPPPQEAHEAIRPVNISIESIDENQYDMLKKSYKLYELIRNHALKTCMSSATYNTINAKISAPMESEFVYKAEENIFLGWQIVDHKPSNVTPVYPYLCGLKQNMLQKYKKIESKFSLIELKSHYSEARLVQLLEEKGIGRPATFASLVDKIQARKYVEKQNITGREIEESDFTLESDLPLETDVPLETVVKRTFGNEKNKLVIQPLGIIVIEFLLEKFPSFFDYDYTKEMETALDKIANSESIWYNICEKCLNELNEETKEYKKFSIEIDDKHTLIIGKHGPVIKCINDNEVSFIPVKKDLDIKDLSNKDIVSLEDVIDVSAPRGANEAIGKYKGKDLFVKNGKFGIYAQWGNERQSLKEQFSGKDLKDIKYIDVLRYLERDISLDPAKPVGFVRELTKDISIRTGKFGDYIFHKKPRVKKPEFYKLNGFEGDYKKCDKVLLLNWIKQTYNIE